MPTNSGVIYRGPDGRMQTDIVVNKSLAASDCGIVQNVIASGVTLSLPASVVGMDFTMRNNGAPAGASVGSGSNSSSTLTITPVAADGVTGNGMTAAVNKSIYNCSGNPSTVTATVAAAAAGSIAGDEIELVGSTPSSAQAFVVSRVIGNWTRQT